jgi:hypothetical protein
MYAGRVAADVVVELGRPYLPGRRDQARGSGNRTRGSPPGGDVSRVELDPAVVVRLYVEEERSVREIADALGTNYSRVYHILRHRVRMRGRGAERARRQSRKHRQVREVMVARIVGGDWKPRHKVLNNHELAQIFGVGQQTIEGVIADLCDQGYLHILARGTYIRSPEHWPARNPES